MESDLPVSAIKMDVENFEYYVLEGAKETLEKHKPIVYCELWENENREKCFELMKGLDYDIKILHKKKLVDFDNIIHQTQCFFFIPKKIK